jgi:hypothetical protein
MSRWQHAQHHFEAAIEMDRGTGARPCFPHAQEDYAGMLLARAKPGDRDQARELLDSARATYDELGMRTHAACASERLERVSEQAAP